MRTNRRGLRIPAVTLALTMVAGLGACSSDDATSAPGDTVLSGTIVVSAASTVGSSDAASVDISVTVGVDAAPDRVESIPLGSVVKLTVLDPSAAQEYHVAGYELGTGVQMAVGAPELFQFTADTAGEFAVTSQTTGAVLLTLKVG